MPDSILLDDDLESTVGLYFQIRPSELIDIEVAAAAVIEWSRGMKAAAAVIDPLFEYRITLIAAEPGSSRWIAKIDRSFRKIETSKINQTAERIKDGWQAVPLLFRMAIGLVIVIPITAVPTINYWFDSEEFSKAQFEQIKAAVKEATIDPVVQSHRKAVFKRVQQDRKITGLGAGAPDKKDWKPRRTIPAEQFAEFDGLFDVQEKVAAERVITQELDVILVSPQLENAERVWIFRQEGISGRIRAVMKDKSFLAALEQSAIRETLRANIPMRIRLRIRQRLDGGEWKVTRGGRSVVEVISPSVGA
ncbi:hypothetical protein [Pikeienuella sp. HZG-20]|uniref:hypothetical protein n=1 Tax=Paludibacillus litoralis TaxID=3133267 RepID=UPI0030ED87C2